MKSILIVVDMQKDFVDGALGTAEARRIVPAVCERIRSFGGETVFTMDTHSTIHPETQEGKRLPVPHCIRGTAGWALEAQIVPLSLRLPHL